VPCYNYGRFLRECVASVLAQSHRDLRVIVIDDASTDDTPEVAAALATEDGRVTVIRHANNHGHVATYNEGIERATADYMLILSADDFLLPGAVARAVAALDERRDVGLAYGLWDFYHAGDRLPPEVAGSGGVDVADPVALVMTLARSNIIATATAVVRTSVQKALGGYRHDLPHAGDLEMWLRFALDSKVAAIRVPQAMYRRHADNMSLRYDVEADLAQCMAAFRLHYHAIRGSLPDGGAVERRVRRILAARATKHAFRALARARAGRFLRLTRMALAEAG
jgi:glycosyltransferase involved in cell wall biosynthesis